MKYVFGDIVVIEGDQIGVVVKSWASKPEVKHDVYVRSFNAIVEYTESQMQRYMVRHKELSEDELEYQSNALDT